MCRDLLCSTMLLLMLVGGCSTQQPAKLVEYREDVQLPRYVDVQNDATYGLYASWDPDPIVKYPLNKGDRLGFDRAEDGTIVAVAGNNRYPIKTSLMVGNYYWAMQH